MTNPLSSFRRISERGYAPFMPIIMTQARSGGRGGNPDWAGNTDFRATNTGF
jgi:hypothetical protein